MYDYHPLYINTTVYRCLRKSQREVTLTFTKSTAMKRDFDLPFLSCDLLRDESPNLGVRRACSAAAKVKGRAVPETRIASTRGVPVTVGDPWRAFSPPLRGGGRVVNPPLYRQNLTRARICVCEIAGRMFSLNFANRRRYSSLFVIPSLLQ